MENICNKRESKKYDKKDAFSENTAFRRLFSINFYIIFNNDNKKNSKLLQEMHLNIKQSRNNFIFYCFEKISKRKNEKFKYDYNVLSNNNEKTYYEYFLISFEGNCYIFETDSESFKENLSLILNVERELLLIGSRNEDVARFIQLFNIKEGTSRPKDKKTIKNKIILIQEKKVIEEIEFDINSIMSNSLIIGMKNQLIKQNQTEFDIIKLLSFRILITYSIRKFYFPMNSFTDSSFFHKEKEFLDTTKSNYNNISDLDKKYQPQQNITMKEMKMNDFIILRAIGKGSNATLYLAFHVYFEQLFVIKKFENSINFEKEKNNYLKLKFYHPNILKCYGFTKDSLIIEFMSNGTLQNFINMKSLNDSFSLHWTSPFFLYTSTNYFHDFQFDFFNNKANKIKFIIEIIYGLEYLHLNDMIYCDLKPDNIFIDHNYMVHLGDFDLSRSNEFFSLKNKNTNDFGSINYFSPDISFNESGYYSYISDVFQLGLVIYAICMGNDLLASSSMKNIKQLEKIIKNKFIPFDFGPFCSYFNQCLKTFNLNRIHLCRIINELTQYGLFFRNLIDESNDYFYYSNIVNEIQLLNQNYYEILIGFIELFSIEITKRKSEEIENIKLNENLLHFNKINICHLEFVLNQFFDVSSFNDIIEKHSSQIKVIIQFLEEKFEMIQNYKNNPNFNYNQMEYIKYQSYLTLYKIYSNKFYAFNDIQKASNYLIASANHNIILSQNLIALKFYDGDEIFKKDLIKSILFFTLSANSGCENSQCNLGEIYSNLYKFPIRITIPQLGIDSNDKEFFGKQALKYYKLAKKQNCSSALYELAAIYMDGIIGIKINKKKAISYLIRSKKQFHQFSIVYLIKFFSMNLIDSNYDIGVFEKEATFLSNSFNNEYAQFALGNFYLYRINDIEKAKKYFNLSAKQNFKTAFTSLANIYLNESRKNKSIELEKKAFDYFLQAANLNEPTALFYVACRYYFGDKPYVKINYSKALNFLQRAFFLNSPKAQNFLGFVYLNGCHQYIKPNGQKAIHYFQLAAENSIH